jgi:hypothetical protein
MLAGIDALLHSIQIPTARGALVADAGASATQVLVQREICQHRVGGDMAQVCTDHHQPEMIGLDVPPALLQAVIHSHAETDPMATLAVLDALLHVGDRVTVGTCRCLFHSEPAVVKNEMSGRRRARPDVMHSRVLAQCWISLPLSLPGVAVPPLVPTAVPAPVALVPLPALPVADVLLLSLRCC